MMEDTHTYPTQTANTSTSNFEGEASHVANLEEKKKDSDNELLPNSEEAISTDEYPHGMRLALLVGAVVLTVFMTSLDQVCGYAYHAEIIALLPLTRNRPSSAPPSPRSRTSSMASTRYPGTARRTSCAWEGSSPHGARPTNIST